MTAMEHLAALRTALGAASRGLRGEPDVSELMPLIEDLWDAVFEAMERLRRWPR